jgi:OFA family oxalate/formate antiporter-like MFS transporter
MAIMGDAVMSAEVLRSTFMTLGAIYFVLTVGGGFFLVNPEGFEKSAAAGTDEDMAPSQLIKSVAFYQVLISYFFAVMPGLLVIGLASNIAQEVVNMSVAQAATVVGVFALLNAIGRLLSGMLADKLGVRTVLKGMYITSIIALAILSFMDLNVPLFYVAMIGVIMSYGSFLALYPGVVSSTFGQKYYSANYGLVYQAYGIAGLVGPIIKKATSTSFDQTFLVAMIASIVGCAILFTLRKPEIEA